MNPLSLTDAVPNDLDNALLVGRVWLNGPHAGPALVSVHNGQVIDITEFGPTMADLLERADLLEVVKRAEGKPLAVWKHSWLIPSRLQRKRPTCSPLAMCRQLKRAALLLRSA